MALAEWDKGSRRRSRAHEVFFDCAFVPQIAKRDFWKEKASGRCAHNDNAELRGQVFGGVRFCGRTVGTHPTLGCKGGHPAGENTRKSLRSPNTDRWDDLSYITHAADA